MPREATDENEAGIRHLLDCIDVLVDGNDPGLQARVDWLYRILDILDTKASNLLSFNSLVLTAQTFLAGMVSTTLMSTGRTTDDVDRWIVVLLLVLVAVPLGAACRALWVFKVKWAWLNKLDRTTDPEPIGRRELERLGEVCLQRTRAVEACLRVSLGSIGAFVLTLVLTIGALLTR